MAGAHSIAPCNGRLPIGRRAQPDFLGLLLDCHVRVWPWIRHGPNCPISEQQQQRMSLCNVSTAASWSMLHSIRTQLKILKRVPFPPCSLSPPASQPASATAVPTLLQGPPTAMTSLAAPLLLLAAPQQDSARFQPQSTTAVCVSRHLAKAN